MKNRILTAVLFVALIGFTACSRKSPNLQGFWEGTIEANQIKLRVVLNISKTPDGKYSATFSSIDQGAQDLAVSSIDVKKDVFRMELKMPPAVYEGNLNKAGTEIAGYWRQGSTSLPLTLKRTAEPSKIEEAKPDSTYAQRGESELHGYWTGALAVQGIELRLALKIAEQSDGTFSGAIDSIDQGANNLPATAVSYAKPSVKVEFSGIGAKFEGEMNQSGSEISGNWTQMGKSNPLTFKRGEPPSTESESKKNYAHVKENDLQGFWKGTLDVKQAKLRLAVKIAKLPDGTFVGTMDSLDQGAKNLPATAISYNEPVVKLEWKGIGGVYDGKMQNGKMTGTWKQGPASFPLLLERTTESGITK
jgi:hypothetical protein